MDASISIINRLDKDKFHLLVNRIAMSMSSNYMDTNGPFTNEQKEKLLSSLIVTKEELELVLSATTLLVRKAVYHVTSIEDFKRELTQSLRMEEDKASALHSVLSIFGKNLVKRIRQKSSFVRTLDDVSWLANIEISSNLTSELFEPKAILQFKLKEESGKTEDLVLDMNEKDLQNLYNCVENIQSALDSLF